MTRKAILQIGTEKTGTTTLQSFLAANRDHLLARGWIYPRFPGALNQTGLAAYAMDADRPDGLKAAFGGDTPEAVPEMRAQMRRRAEAELKGGQGAIFCSEHCHSRLVTRGEVERLRDFLSPFFDEIEVSVYLRRQDRVALSLYSTQLKSGDTPRHILPAATDASLYYNYDRFLALWEDVFGADAIKVRLFERDLLVNGSVVDDFLATWDLGPIDAYRAVPNENASISVAAQEYLRQVNPHLAAWTGRAGENLRGIVVSALENAHGGRGARPARADAQAFYERFRSSNARVAARYFPDRSPLFEEDFSSYPDTEDNRLVETSTILAIATRLLGDTSARIDALEAEIGIREAALAWRDDPEAALARVRTALSAFPDHAGLHRTLGEYYLRLDRPAAAAQAAEDACARAPDNWEYRHFLGIARAAAGNFAGARMAQKAALERNPDHAGVQAALAAVEARLNGQTRQHA